MRFLAISVIGVCLLAAPALAQQKPYRAECVKLTQQIARYERDAGWARDRGNDSCHQHQAKYIQRRFEQFSGAALADVQDARIAPSSSAKPTKFAFAAQLGAAELKLCARGHFE